MPLLKFETKLVKGKPNIVYETEDSDIPNKKFTYKTKSLKYPLRSKIQKHNESNIDKKMTNNSNKTKPKLIEDNHKDESIFNLVREKDKSQKEKQEFEPSKGLSDKEIDNIMKEVILDNKDALSEEQLVDLLAKLYLEAKSLKVKPQPEKRTVTPVEREIMYDSNYTDIPKVLSKENKEPANYRIDYIDKVNNNRNNYTNNNHTGIANNFSNNNDHNIPNKSEYTPRKFPVQLTMAEKKRLQWEKEKKEMNKISEYNPWGKPGCGAPIRSSFEFTQSQDDRIMNMQVSSRNQLQNETYLKSDNKQAGGPESYIDSMTVMNKLTKEEKRKQWLRELDEQVAEREKARKMNSPDSPELNHQFTNVNGTLSNRGMSDNTGGLFGRGKGLADLNQMSPEEAILKRNKQIEQKEAIRLQIEEREQQKRVEKERKIQMDLEEELRLKGEKRQAESQYQLGTSRAREKDEEYGRKFHEQKNQLEAAEKAALLEKKLKRLHKLEMGGHDTRGLRAELVAALESATYRDVDPKQFAISVSPDSLENSVINLNNLKNPPQQPPQHDTNAPKLEFSPRIFGKYAITEDQGVQTVDKPFVRYRENDYENELDDEDMRLRMERGRLRKQRSADEESSRRNRSKVQASSRRARTPQSPQSADINKHNRMQNYKRHQLNNRTIQGNRTKRVKKPEPIDKRPPWGAKKVTKKFVPQSKRDPFYEDELPVRKQQKQERVDKILNQVRANLDRIPDRDVLVSHRHGNKRHCDNDLGFVEEEKHGMNEKGTFDMRKSTERTNRNLDVPIIDPQQLQQQHSQKQQENTSRKFQSQRQHTDRSAEQHVNYEVDDSQWFYDSGGGMEHPIVRTTDILDPAMADDALPFSRENTGREKARKGYFKSMNPIEYGSKLENKTFSVPQQRSQDQKETFYKPNGHPTERQNTILQQLSDIRQGLLQKQKEIETNLSHDDGQS